MQVVNVKYVERSLSMDGTIMRGTYTASSEGCEGLPALAK